MICEVYSVRERKIGSHILALSKFFDDANNLDFYGVIADCIIQFKGTLAECEGRWRQWVKALNAADRRNKKRKEGGAK